MQQLLSNVMRNGDSVLRISALEVHFGGEPTSARRGLTQEFFLFLHGVDFADALRESRNLKLVILHISLNKNSDKLPTHTVVLPYTGQCRHCHLPHAGRLGLNLGLDSQPYCHETVSIIRVQSLSGAVPTKQCKKN
jgi:hypothetical protein